MQAAQTNQIVQRVIDYVEKNYAAPISLRDVARYLGYSPTYLTEAFSRCTGTPVTAWIIQRRIRAAQDLLRNGNIRISNAYEAAGFNDACYFRRQFLRYVGVSPGRYRQEQTSETSCAPRYL